MHADKHKSFYKLTLSFLMEVARHVQSTQNTKLVIFFQYIKGMLQRNIEHFLKKPIWEKLGIAEMK